MHLTPPTSDNQTNNKTINSRKFRSTLEPLIYILIDLVRPENRHRKRHRPTIRSFPPHNTQLTLSRQSARGGDTSWAAPLSASPSAASLLRSRCESCYSLPSQMLPQEVHFVPCPSQLRQSNLQASLHLHLISCECPVFIFQLLHPLKIIVLTLQKI